MPESDRRMSEHRENPKTGATGQGRFRWNPFYGLPWLTQAGLWLLIAGLLLGIALAFLPYTVDDAFITFRYARNLSQGLGPVFNAGERVEGYTSFLWMLLASAGLSLGIDAVVLSKALGLACSLITIWLTMAMAQFLSDHPRRVAVASGLLLAASVDLALNSVAGLETALFTLLLTAAMARQIWEERGDGWPLASLFFGLAALSRPEGLALGGLSWLYDTVAGWRRLGAASWRRALLRGLPFGVLVIAHFAWRYSYYGELLPNTYYAKSIPWGPRLLVGLFYVERFLVRYGGIFLFAWLLALWHRDRRLRYLLFMSAAGVAVVIWEGGDWMEGGRFLVPVLPILCLITAETLSAVYERLAAGSRRLAQGIVLTVALLYVGLNARSLTSLHHYASVRAAGYEAAHRQLARWLEETLPEGGSVALMDVGIVGYYTDLRVIDITGLTDSTIAHAPGTFLMRSYDTAYILDQSPDVIVLVSWDPDGEPDLFVDRAIYDHPDFQRDYTYLHKLEHYQDAELGDYYLLVYRRRSETGSAPGTDPWAWSGLWPTPGAAPAFEATWPSF